MRNEVPRNRDEIGREDWGGPEEFGHRWFEYGEEVRFYVEKHKRLPTRTTIKDGLKIGAWLDKQRRLGRATSGETLHPGRRWYLDEWVPEWELTPNDHLWLRQAEALAKYVVDYGRYPTLRESVDGYHLGNWLAFQREQDRKLGEDGMPTERGLWLDEHVPGWNVGDDRAEWREIADGVAAWMRTNEGRNPSPDVVVSGVNALRWLRLQRYRPRSSEQSAWLDANVPGWSGDGRASRLSNAVESEPNW